MPAMANLEIPALPTAHENISAKQKTTKDAQEKKCPAKLFLQPTVILNSCASLRLYSNHGLAAKARPSLARQLLIGIRLFHYRDRCPQRSRCGDVCPRNN